MNEKKRKKEKEIQDDRQFAALSKAEAEVTSIQKQKLAATTTTITTTITTITTTTKYDDILIYFDMKLFAREEKAKKEKQKHMQRR